MAVADRSSLALDIRRRQAVETVTQVQARIEAWLAFRRRPEVSRGRHKTPLEAIESVLGGSAKALEAEIDNVTAAASPGEFYRACRRIEEAAAWLQRLWQFYRDKFDQRDLGGSDSLPSIEETGATAVRSVPPGPTLAAADEIIWSAYRQVMAMASVLTSVPHGAPPLAFIAPEYSPSAIGTQRPLAQHLQLYIRFPTFDDALQALVARLAVPLLALPTWVVGAPWFLIFIVHEVGHHLTRQLALLDHFNSTIERHVRAVTGMPPSFSSRWSPWTDEIVADAWSILLAGPAAAEAVADVEFGEESDVRAVPGPNTYPPPVIRVELMRRLSLALLLGPPTLPEIYDITRHRSDALVAELDDQIDSVVAALRAPLPNGLGDMALLTGHGTTSPDDLVEYWKTNLLAMPAERVGTIEAARYLSAGVFRAWRDLQVTTRNVDEYEIKAAAIRDAAMTLFAKAGPGGDRAAEQPDGRAPELARSLTHRLLALGDQVVRAAPAVRPTDEGR